MGQREGSAVRSTWFSSRRPEFSSHYPYQVTWTALQDLGDSRRTPLHSHRRAGGGAHGTAVGEAAPKGRPQKGKVTLWPPGHFLLSIILLRHQPYCNRSHTAKMPLRLMPSLSSELYWPLRFSSSIPSQASRKPHAVARDCTELHQPSHLLPELCASGGSRRLQLLTGQVWSHFA